MTDENNALHEYERLLFERDKYRKRADEYLKEYIRTFGELLTDVFRKKISCIEKKKMIGYCQKRINKGERIDINAMNTYIREEMEEYDRQLEAMINNNKACRDVTVIDRGTVAQIKRIYRRIAKKIHPDIHPGTMDIPVLCELWDKVTDAYHRNDLDTLEELEIQIDSILRKLGDDVPEADIEDIEEKMKELEQEIEKIIATDPYQYKFLLEDEEAVSDFRSQLQDELKEYTEYEKQLSEILRSYVAGGAQFKWEN